MNFTINSQHLAESLRPVCKIVPTKPAVQILSHMLIKVDGDVMFQTTDLEVSLIVKTGAAQLHTRGSVVLPALKLLALVEQFPDGDVNMASDEGGQVTVRYGSFKTQLQVLSVDDFPVLPAPTGAPVTIDAVELSRAIERTRSAISTTTTKYVLQGALLKLLHDKAAMVTTNGKVLAVATMPYSGEPATAIVPMKTLDALAAQGNPGSFDMTVDKQHLFFSMEGRTLISRMIDGEFPKYDRVIPRDNDKVATIDRSAFAAALRRVRVIAGDDRATYMQFAPNQLLLSSSSFAVGSADETFNIEYAAAPLKLCINSDSVLNFLDAAAGQTVKVALKDENSAALFMDGAEYITVIMLMKA